MLKVSKQKIGLISNPEINLFFRKSIRGGMSFIARRYAKSDYKDSDVNNCKQKMNHIPYTDINKLYGSTMLFDLPIGDYRFENKKKQLKNTK